MFHIWGRTFVFDLESERSGDPQWPYTIRRSFDACGCLQALADYEQRLGVKVATVFQLCLDGKATGFGSATFGGAATSAGAATGAGAASGAETPASMVASPTLAATGAANSTSPAKPAADLTQSWQARVGTSCILRAVFGRPRYPPRDPVMPPPAGGMLPASQDPQHSAC